MNILVLSKRQYTGKDLIDDRYGRLYEIPAALAARGHIVRGIALSYRRKDEQWHEWADAPGMRWRTINAMPFGVLHYLKAIKECMENFRPDVIWASSDTIHAFLGWVFGQYIGCAYVVDLYDNYESFGLNKIPGMDFLLKFSCRRSTGLSVASLSLRNLAYYKYSSAVPCIVLKNGVNEDLFHPFDKDDSRKRFGFPLSAKIIGTAGSINKNRGIDDLFRAFINLSHQHGDIWLCYAGPCDKTPDNYQHDRIIYLGNIDYSDVGRFFSALDVVVICNKNSDFGEFCFPQKFYEIVAVKTPLIAASVGGVVDVLGSDSAYLYPPGDDVILAEKINQLLNVKRPLSIPVVRWVDEAEKMERFFNLLICK